MHPHQDAPHHSQPFKCWLSNDMESYSCNVNHSEDYIIISVFNAHHYVFKGLCDYSPLSRHKHTKKEVCFCPVSAQFEPTRSSFLIKSIIPPPVLLTPAPSMDLELVLTVGKSAINHQEMTFPSIRVLLSYVPAFPSLFCA